MVRININPVRYESPIMKVAAVNNDDIISVSGYAPDNNSGNGNGFVLDENVDNDW